MTGIDPRAIPSRTPFMLCTIWRYLLAQFLVAFLLSLLVFTFVISLGVVLKLTELIAMGASPMDVLRIFLYKVPEALMLTIPMSVLAACLLIFGRLSADGEIMALRACGINLWAAAAAPLAFSVLCAGACLYINDTLAPAGHEQRKKLVQSLRLDPLRFFQPGTFIRRFPGMTFRIGSRDGNKINNVIIYDFRKPNFRREIIAEHGEIIIFEEEHKAQFVLRNVRIDPLLDTAPNPGFAETWRPEPIELNVVGVADYVRGHEDRSLGELLEQARSVSREHRRLDAAAQAKIRMPIMVEFSRRLVLSAFCISFALCGIPLGLRGHRRESTIGIAGSLVIVFLCYLFISLAESLAVNPAWRPDLIIWTPVALSAIGGIVLMQRSN